MNLLVNGNLAADLSDATFRRVLNIYPEEKLEDREVLADALRAGEIEFSELKAESGRILIPWQMFLLSPSKLEIELSRIERLRHKAASVLAAKRTGAGNITSKRILDRLIRCLFYLSQNHSLKSNEFCGSLRGLSASAAADSIAGYFGIDRRVFRLKNKPQALAYLIERIEEGQVNICQGVLTNKLLPHLSDSRSVYKNTSGFVIRNEHVPFIFLPSEVNPDEREGRQILTLVFLLSLIGLDAYDFQIEKDFKTRMLTARGREGSAYLIASEFLLPFEETETLRGTVINASVRDRLASRYKMSPSAVVTILRKRKLITHPQFNSLFPPMPPPRSGKGGQTPPIEQSIRKFNGRYAYEVINRDLRGGKITSIQAQYLLLGAPYKRGFKQYRKNLGI